MAPVTLWRAIMDANDLKEYLKMVLDVEKDRYLQQQILQKLQSNAMALTKPTCREIQEPEAETMGAIGYMGVILGAVLGGLLGGAIGYFMNSTVVFALITGSIGLVIAYCVVQRQNKVEYEKELHNYQKAVQDEKDHLRIELERFDEVHSYVVREIRTVSNNIERTSHFLQSLYDADVIFPKYRNFVMVASLYEYFCSGRCSTLEGRDGAYNLLEKEIRMERIISQLDQVICRLDLIRENQYMIYSAVQEINTRLADLEISNKQLLQIIHSANQNVSQMRTELDRLQKTSQLTAYYAERAQVELEYMNRMNFYAKKYDNAGFFLQRPPV